MEAARRLGELDETQLAARAEELAEREDQLQSVRAAARGVAAASEPAAVRDTARDPEKTGARG
jgi:hypothetical protein